ncbi:MAG: zinc-binding dehydrogenase [Novosphingobium sp.]
MATLAADGRLNPHIDRILPLSRWHEAYAAMAERGIVGKVVLEPGK